MELGLRGRSVLITGGHRGIGFAIARAFADEGCAVHLAARSAPALERACKQLQDEFGVAAVAHPADLSVEEEAQRLAAACGAIDILVNNAGAIPAGGIEDVDARQWRDAWALKVFGYIDLTREIYAGMRSRGQGVIVNVIGHAGNLRPSAYLCGFTADVALVAFTRALGGESLDHGVRMVGVSPGEVMNDRGIAFLRRQAELDGGDPERWRERLAELPGGRAASEEDIAAAVVFLASDRASYVSGTVLTVDGGLSGRRAIE